jgi:hypothetical protein
MASTIQTKYGTEVTLTCDPSSLATSSTRVAGRESTAVNNTSVLALDYLLGGKVTTGTSPTVSKQIDIYVYASFEDTPTYPDVFDGTDSAETVTSENVRNACLRLAAAIFVDATSNRTYYFGPVSIASLFGGNCPQYWGIFVVHDTAVNLHATAGNHAFYAMPILAQTV